MAETSKPFDGDALNRFKFASALIELIGKIPRGVIAVDGAWGSGKTWFGQRLQALLAQDDKTKSVWIDAFAADWHDDPALSLLAELASQLPAEKSKEFIAAAAPLASKVLLAAGKGVLKAGGNLLGIDTDVIDGVVEAAQGAGEAYIKKRLLALDERKRSLEKLHELLQKAVEDGGFKLVVFVDELDRCSPAYAIRLLERINHLFAIDGVVFVLLWNRKQIQQAVKVFYGQDTDGQMYLDRFVDYPLSLPNHHLTRQVAAMGLIVEAEIQKLTSSAHRQLHQFAPMLGGFADVLHLTAREVKHVCAWWTTSVNHPYPVLDVWLLCLKVKHPDYYEKLRDNDIETHRKVAALLGPFVNHSGLSSQVAALIKFHEWYGSRHTTPQVEFVGVLFGSHPSDLVALVHDAILRLESLQP